MGISLDHERQNQTQEDMLEHSGGITKNILSLVLARPFPVAAVVAVPLDVHHSPVPRQRY